MAKRWNFPKVIKRVNAMKRSIPRRISIIMKKHFEDNFKKQGFVDEGLSPWKARKRKETGPRRNILAKSGDLKDSIAVRSATFKRIAVGSYGLKYARRHNRGLKGMPKRQFVGPSSTMNRKISKLINSELSKTFR